MRRRRVGAASLGLVLIGSGIAMLWNTYSDQPVDLARYWPVVFILLGAEILIANARARASGSTVRIGLSSLALLGLVLVVALGWGPSSPWLLGCSPGLNLGNVVPFPHQITRTVQLALDLEGVRAVEIDTRFGQVDVSTATVGGQPGGEAFVTGQGRTVRDAEAAAAAAGASVRRVGSRLIIRAEGEGSDSRSSSASVNLVLALPAEIELSVTSEFGSIAVSGLNGPVLATGRFGRISLSSISGAVTVETEHCSLDAVGIAGPLSVRSVYGSVTCDEIGGPLEVDSRHGAVTVRRPRDRVKIYTTYARVAVYYDRMLAAGCEVTSVHGQITVEMPATSTMTVDAVSERSGVSTNLSGVQLQAEGRGNRALGNVNGGGHPVRLRTEYARIEVRGR